MTRPRARSRAGWSAAGIELLSDYATPIGIPVEHTGALLVAWDRSSSTPCPALKDKAARNGYERCEIIDADRGLP